MLFYQTLYDLDVVPFILDTQGIHPCAAGTALHSLIILNKYGPNHLADNRLIVRKIIMSCISMPTYVW